MGKASARLRLGIWHSGNLFFYLRAVGRKVLWSSACVCLCVCLCALPARRFVSRSDTAVYYCFCWFMVFRRQRVAMQWKMLENSSWVCTFCCNVIYLYLRIISRLPNSEAEGRSLLLFERPIWYGNTCGQQRVSWGQPCPIPRGEAELHRP